MLLRILGLLLLVWLAFVVLGAVLKGAFYLVVIGGLLFLCTAAYAAIKNRTP